MNFQDGSIFGHFVGFRWRPKNGWQVGWSAGEENQSAGGGLNPTYH
jgi:hypothetical protein